MNVRSKAFRVAVLAGWTIQAAAAMAAEPDRKPVEVLARWTGTPKDAALRRLAPQQGFITDAAAWQRLWKAWRGDEGVAAVDFTKDAVLVGTVGGPNRVIVRPVLAAGGNLRFVVVGAEVAGPGFGYAMLKVSRKGVKTINGTALPEAAPQQYIRVEVRGKLTTGMMAIGGETTGTAITANGITWELDLGRNADMRARARQLNSKTVVVKGSLQRRAGVEIRQRWIVTVSSLVSAEATENPAAAKSDAALTVTMVIPTGVPSFAGRTLELQLWEYDPFLADASAKNIGKIIDPNFSHTAGKETRKKFAPGPKPADVKERMGYYVTLFVLDAGKRTHMGERDGNRGISKVLTQGAPKEIQMIVRDLGR